MRRKFRIRYKRLLIFLLVVFVFCFCGVKVFNLKISNIYVSGNKYMSDQFIIELAGIENYPKASLSFSNNLKNRLEKSDYINSAKVYKKGLTKVYIEVSENRPLVYDEVGNKVILTDGKKVSEMFDVPILVNAVDSSIYEKFLDKFSQINDDVFMNISEVEYTPNDVDKELFMFSMKDGNYVSVNLNRFVGVNMYLDMVKKFNNKKGILYLDSGEYFKILNN